MCIEKTRWSHTRGIYTRREDELHTGGELHWGSYTRKELEYEEGT